MDISDLGYFSIATKEGWSTYVNAAPCPRPPLLTAKKLSALSSKDKTLYDQQRELWHANTGTMHTTQVKEILEELWADLRANVQRGQATKGALALEGDSFLGKTTIAQTFAKEFHLRELAMNGELTEAGDQRWPVCYVSLSGHPTVKDLCASLLYFFAHPGARSGNATDLQRRSLDTFTKCKVGLLVIDDLHFLRWDSADGSKVSNHLKSLVNNFPITMLLIGTGLTELGIKKERYGLGKAVLGPTARRTTSIPMEPYVVDGGRESLKEWRSVVHSIERNLVLARHRDGILTYELSEYLFDRSTGYMGSLITLINRAATRAIINGEEAITERLLEQTRIDVAAEDARKATTARRQNATGTRPRRPQPRSAAPIASRSKAKIP